MSNVKLNLYLKIIGELAKISLKLTHHVARHTCATTVLLENNVPMEQVSKWLGHSDISSTQVYGKITKSRLDTTASRINKLY
jgi:site-specific recombinase XerD